MAAEGEVTVTAKITADTKGGKEVEQELDRIEKKSKQSAKGISDGFAQAQQAASSYNNIVRRLTNFSIFTGGLASVLSLWDRITASANKAKEEASEFAKEQAKAADKKRIEDLAESYRKLGEEIGRAAKERQRANELEDMETSESDRLEDNEAKLQKAQQIAALDPNDPAYEEKKQRIENAYEVAAAQRSVDRSRRDAETKEKREYAEAEAKHGEAAEKEFSLIADREELQTLRRKANEARAASVQENVFDVKTFTEGFVNNLRSILSLDGEHFWSDRTAKGDEERKRQEEEAKRYDEAAKALEEKIKSKEAEIADISAEATHHSKKAGVYGMSAANTSVAQSAAEISGQQSTAAADKAVADKENRLADAQKAERLLQSEKQRIKAEIAAEQSRKDAANQAVYTAEGNMESAKLSGNRREQISANAALRDAQASAQNVAHEADSAIAALTETLKSVETRLKAAQSAIKQSSKQQQYAWNESPAGD